MSSLDKERAFDTLDVLSAITGVLVTPRHVDGIYEVLTFMAGEPVWTHQLPRVSREAQAVMLKWQPMLAEACTEAKQVTPDNWQQWARTWLKRYGARLMVPRLNAEQHKSINPLEEAAAFGKPVVVLVDGEAP